jgi:hypothetical protein
MAANGRGGMWHIAAKWAAVARISLFVFSQRRKPLPLQAFGKFSEK